MSFSLDDVIARLERVEKELEELKKSRTEDVDSKGKEIAHMISSLLKKRFRDKERIMAFVALEKRPKEDGAFVWDEWMIVGPMPGMSEVEIPKISKLMESCSNEARLKILHEVFKSPKYPKEITEITGLTGGALYHHLDVLTEAGLIERDKLGRIRRTANGELFTDIVFNIIAQVAHAIPKLEERE